MLETKINLLKAIRENKSKKVVKRRMTKYVVAYSKKENPTRNEVSDYKDTLLDYIRYMEKNGEK